MHGTMTLCAVCHRVIISWETPSMIEGMPPDVQWNHYMMVTDHKAQPPKFVI